MNQAIQIVDGFEYDNKCLRLKIIAINSGALVNCFITEVEEEEANSFYAVHQFDIEEHITLLLAQERINDNGEVVFSKSLFPL